jgi:hypothetical protein
MTGEARDAAFESDLKALDEAVRASAKAAGWEEEDTSAEGILSDHVQPHPGGVFEDFELDLFPEGLRFLGWATFETAPHAIIVTAEVEDATPVILGSWPMEVWQEYLRRSADAEPPETP